MTDRVDQLLADILDGPDALLALLDGYAEPNGPLSTVDARPARVVFTGLGSSRYAASSVAAHMRANGLTAWTEYASTSAPARPDEDLVVVAVSASGGTRETVEVARRHSGRSRVIAVTNRPDSALASAGDHILPLFAGEERCGIATRTFRATVAVLGLLAGRWLGEEPTVDGLRHTVGALRAVIDGRDAWLSDVADRLDGAAAIDVIGDDADAALVQQAALMLREGPRLPAEAHETGDWLHTAIYLALPGHRAILFSGARSDAEVVRVIAGRGGETIVVGEAVEGAAATIPYDRGSGAIDRAIVGSVVAELLTLELWRRSTANVAIERTSADPTRS